MEERAISEVLPSGQILRPKPGDRVMVRYHSARYGACIEEGTVLQVLSDLSLIQRETGEAAQWHSNGHITRILGSAG